MTRARRVGGGAGGWRKGRVWRAGRVEWKAGIGVGEEKQGMDNWQGRAEDRDES